MSSSESQNWVQHNETLGNLKRELFRAARRAVKEWGDTYSANHTEVESVLSAIEEELLKVEASETKQDLKAAVNEVVENAIKNGRMGDISAPEDAAGAIQYFKDIFDAYLNAQ